MHVKHHNTVCEIDRQAWDRLFPGRAENWGYVRACELSTPDDLRQSALGVYDDDRLIAAAPLFSIDYRLAAPLGEWADRLGQKVEPFAPWVVKMPAICIGLPMAEDWLVGLDPDLDETGCQHALMTLLHGYEAHAKQKGIKLIGLKDVPETARKRFADQFEQAGFSALPSLPIATTEIEGATLEDYLATLPAKRRTDMRRKLKAAKDVSFEWLDDIDDINDTVSGIYRQTLDRYTRDYEGLDEFKDNHFSDVLKHAGSRARMLIGRHDGEIVCCNLILIDDDRVLGKKVAMKQPLGRQKNLYFVNWLKTVEFCQRNNIRVLEAGQTTYVQKVRMGCKLRRSWIMFKHGGSIIGPAFRRLAPYFSFASNDPDLIKLGDKAVYVEERRG